MSQNLNMITLKTKNISLFASTMILLYIGSVFLLSGMSNTSFLNVAILRIPVSAINIATVLLVDVAVLSALALLVLPGLIWTISTVKKFEDGFSFFAIVLANSLILLILPTMLFKLATPYRIDRISLLGIIAFEVIAGLCYLKAKNREAVGIQLKIKRQDFVIMLSIGLMLFLSIFSIFFGKIFIEDFDAGGLEVYQAAKSLEVHALAYGAYDLFKPSPVGFIVTNPNFMDGYLNMSFLALLGDTASSIGLSYLIFITLIYFTIHAFLPVHSRCFVKTMMSASVALLLFLYTVIFLFYTSYFPHFVDITTDAPRASLFVLFLLLQIYFLINRKKLLTLVFAVFSALTLYSGPVLTLIIFITYYFLCKGRDERQFLKSLAGVYILCIGAIVGMYMAVGFWTGDIYVWIEMFKNEYIYDYVGNEHIGRNSLEDSLLFFKYYIAFAGGLPVLGLLMVKSKDKMSSILSVVVIVYLCIVLGGSHKNLHYMAPIVFLPLIIFFRRINQSKINMTVAALLCSVSIIGFIMISFPKVYRVHTDYRDYGSRTCLLFDSFYDVKNMGNFLSQQEEAMCARLGSECDGEEWWAEDSAMVWLYNAHITKTPKKKYDFYFSKNDTPPRKGIQLSATDGEYYFWTNHNMDLIRADVPTEKDIFSDFFRELAGRH